MLIFSITCRHIFGCKNNVRVKMSDFDLTVLEIDF